MAPGCHLPPLLRKSPDRGAIVSAADPFVGGAKSELGDFGFFLYEVDRAEQLIDVDSVYHPFQHSGFHVLSPPVFFFRVVRKAETNPDHRSGPQRASNAMISSVSLR